MDLKHGILGLADKGMNDESVLQLVTPYKENKIIRAIRRAMNDSEKKNIRSRCTALNLDVSKARITNENVIADLCRWAAARGTSAKRTWHDLDRCKLRIEICRGLTNFLYRQRNLG